MPEPVNTPPVDAGSKPVDAGAQSVKTYSESEFQDAIAKRQAAVEEKRALEAKLKEIEDARLAETAQYKDAYEKVKPELEQTKAELERLKSFEADVIGKEEARVKEGLEKLDEASKAEYSKFIAKLSLSERSEWIASKAGIAQTPATSLAANRPGQKTNSAAGTAPMSFNDRVAAFKANPQAFAKVLS